MGHLTAGRCVGNILKGRSDLLGGLLDGREDSRVRSASAYMAIHSRADLGLGRLCCFEQQLRAFYDLSVIAISTLGGLLSDNGLLQRVESRRCLQFVNLCV